MSRSGDEMIKNLARLLGPAKKIEKTASVEEPVEEKKEEVVEEKTTSATMDIVNSLYKIAEELDAKGADEAASLVDEALKIIVENINKQADIEDLTEYEKMIPDLEEPFEEESDEVLPELEESDYPSRISGREPKEMDEFETTEDSVDEVMSDEEIKSKIEELTGE